MCDQDSRATGGLMTVTPTIPGGSASPPPNVVAYQREIIALVHQIQNEETLRRIYNLTSYLYIKK